MAIAQLTEEGLYALGYKPIGARDDREALSPAFRQQRGSHSFFFEGRRWGFVGASMEGQG